MSRGFLYETTKSCQRFKQLDGGCLPHNKKIAKSMLYIADIRNNYNNGLLQKCLVCEDSLKCEDFNASEIIK